MTTSFQSLDLPTVPLDGTNLIEASAGTGKTYTISNLVLRLVLEKKIDIRKILVVTFTDAATKELRERIRSNLTEAFEALEAADKLEKGAFKEVLTAAQSLHSNQDLKQLLRKAIISFDEAAIYTIHGFCHKILNDYAFESGLLFDSELITDQTPLIENISDDFWRLTFGNAHPVLTGIADENSLRPSELISFSRLLLRSPLLKVIPENEEDPYQELILTFEKIRDLWVSQSAEIRELLMSAKGLKRAEKEYRLDTMELNFLQLDRLAENPNSGIKPAAIIKFSTESLLNGCTSKGEPPSHPFFNLCQRFKELVESMVLFLRLSYADYLKSQLKKRKQDQRSLSFDDLLTNVREGLLDPQKGEILQTIIRDQYDVALIDEFQDTDPVQFDIFTSVFDKNRSLFYIGDPKQSIYGFRGADLFSYLQAGKNIKEGRRFTLAENWRSETGFVESINTFFSTIRNPFVLGDAIGFHSSTAAESSKGNINRFSIEGEDPENLRLWFLSRQELEVSSKTISKEVAQNAALQLTLNEISRLLWLGKEGKAKIGSRPLLPSDIAILVLRNADAQEIKDRLSLMGIPAVITKSGNVFHSESALEVHQILTAISTPTNPQALNTALATKMIGFSGEKICSFLEDETAMEEYEEQILRFSQYHDLWKSRGFIRMFRKLLADYHIRQKLLAQPEGERLLTNLLHLSELIHEEAVKNNLGINSILSWFKQQRVGSEEQEKQELRLEKDGDALQICTVFKSKGLQYPIVFCPLMWQKNALKNSDTLYYHQDDELVLDISSSQQNTHAVQRSQTEDLADQMRLLYVALTRAMNRCYLVAGKIGTRSFTAMDYAMLGGFSDEFPDLPTMARRLGNLSEEEMLVELSQRLTTPDNVIRIEASPLKNSVPYENRFSADQSPLSCPEYHGKNRWLRDWGIASYSRLTASSGGKSAYEPEELLLDDEGQDLKLTLEETDERSFFSFPSGRVAGTCVHSIFEKLDFTDPTNDEEVIHQELLRYGLTDAEAGSEYDQIQLARVQEMLNRVKAAPLLEDSPLTLGEITPSSKLVELEFYYPLVRLTNDRLAHCFGEATPADAPELADFKGRIERLNFKPIEGFMHGFIDLIFQYQGRFYLADWKTNHLGNRWEDYSPQKIAHSMVDKLYTLQYYIYTLALHKYLESKLPDYSYDTHIGGVFYLFVRGLHPQKPGNGVFFDRPPESRIRQLCEMIR